MTFGAPCRGEVKRFDWEDVDRRPAEFPALQCCRQGVEIDDGAPRIVDQECAVFHAGDLRSTNHAVGRRCLWYVQGDDIAADKEIIE